MTTSVQETMVCSAGLPDLQRACVPERVAAQAAQRPDAVAVRAGSQPLAYRDLEDRSNRLAWHLRSLGVDRDVPVGLYLPRSLDVVVGALGILKARGAYLPLDPSYPAERLALMLEDSQAPVLVSSPCLNARLPAGKWKLVDLAAPEVAGQPSDRLPLEVEPTDLAYIIYTSGSTGKPKGVEITHGSLANLVSWHQGAFGVSPVDRASQVASMGFDAAVWELWPYLTAGASIHLVDEVTRGSAELFRDWLLSERITISFVPTPLAERMLALQWPPKAALRILLTGGDSLRHYPPAGLPFVLVNNYGPTECTVVATSGVVPSEDGRQDALPAIGSAIANTRIYLLNEEQRSVPPGSPGEIHIAGAGLARGYRNEPELTSEKFIPNPFSTEPGSRLYKTGDRARWLPGGQLDFLGRIDDQIKIRGYRIEPSEIVNALNRHPGIREGLVLASEDLSGEKRLVAYVVLKAGEPVTLTNLRDFLRGRLPEYMLPAVFVQLDSFPLTAHGKVDRTRLPAPDPANTLKDEAWPGTPTKSERRMAEILAELLGLEEIAPDDNFFFLGGHSLLGAQLIVRLREAFGVEITLRTLFEAPTVAGLAAEVDRRPRTSKTAPGADRPAA